MLGLGVFVGFGVADEEGFAVGRVVGLGVAAGLQLPTPEPETRPDDGGTWYLAGGSVPGAANNVAASARMPAMSGSWIDPRAS